MYTKHIHTLVYARVHSHPTYTHTHTHTPTNWRTNVRSTLGTRWKINDQCFSFMPHNSHIDDLFSLSVFLKCKPHSIVYSCATPNKLTNCGKSLHNFTAQLHAPSAKNSHDAPRRRRRQRSRLNCVWCCVRFEWEWMMWAVDRVNECAVRTLRWTSRTEGCSHTHADSQALVEYIFASHYTFVGCIYFTHAKLETLHLHSPIPKALVSKIM